MTGVAEDYPACAWRYNPPPIRYWGKAGHVVRMHSSAQQGLDHGTGTTYRILAIPTRPGRSGDRCFIVDETGEVLERRWTGVAYVNATPANAALLEGDFMAAWPTAKQKKAFWRPFRR